MDHEYDLTLGNQETPSNRLFTSNFVSTPRFRNQPNKVA